MRAVVLDRLGADSPFRIAELPMPAPGPRQVRVRVRAVGINPADIGIRAGFVPLPGSATFPLVLGWDVAGEIDAVGAEITGWAPGQPVFGFSAYLETGVGTYAEYVCLDADDVAARPAGCSAAEAATLPSSGLTAMQALDAARVVAGDELVVIGAAGAVGGLITQLAVARGARVTAVVGAADAGRVRELGATDVIDRRGDVVAELRARDASVAINAARDAGHLAVAGLRDNGRFATIADHPVPAAQRGITPVEVLVHSDAGQLHELARLAGAGAVSARVSRELPAADAGLAHELILAGGLAGKVVLHFATEPLA